MLSSHKGNISFFAISYNELTFTTLCLTKPFLDTFGKQISLSIIGLAKITLAPSASD